MRKYTRRLSGGLCNGQNRTDFNPFNELCIGPRLHKFFIEASVAVSLRENHNTWIYEVEKKCSILTHLDLMLPIDCDVCAQYSQHIATETVIIEHTAPCWLRGCKNGPALFPGRMSYKATKPGLVCLSYLSMFFIVLLFIRAPFYVLC